MSALLNSRSIMAQFLTSDFCCFCLVPHQTWLLAAQQSQLNPDLKEPSFKFIWTARQVCSFYSGADGELNGRGGEPFYWKGFDKNNTAE